MEIITIRQMLRAMETGAPFSCTVVSYDRRRRKGGQIIEYGEARLLREDEEKQAAGARPLTKQEKLAAALKETKTPRHGKWYTRNIRILQDGHPTSLIKKIHPPLVVFFNHKQVVP